MPADLKNGKTKRLVLLDTHAIIHRAYHALPDFMSSKGEPTGALYGLTTMVLKIANDLKPDWIVATYDLPKPTHRHEAYKDYKAGRATADEELVSQLKSSRELLEALAIPIYDKEGFEADDILGTIVEKLTANSQKLIADIVIASGDMDTMQLVKGSDVKVYTLKRGINDTILYDEDAVMKRFGFSPKLLPDYKGLSGDPSDNIIGIKGIGEKTATTLIQKFGTIEEIYKNLEKSEEVFIEEGIKPRIIELLKNGKEEAEFSKILATIRRDAPIDFSLPERTWAESVDIGKAEQVFSNFDFRTMGTRLRGVIEGRIKNGNNELGIKNKGDDSEKLKADSQKPEAFSPESALMLWLINSSITNPTPEDIRTYTKKDQQREVEEFLLEEIKKKNLNYVYEKIEKPLIPVIEKMNGRGVKIDTKYLAKLGEEYRAKVLELQKEIWQLAGGEFNINSPKQMGEILFIKLGLKAKNQKKTGTGALSTKESELTKLIDVHPIISLIIKYRELAKLLSTYIDNLIPMVGDDGRLHAKFLQAGTTTGRMSSESPNLQNIPNHTELGLKIRNAFVAEKENVLVSFDYSQVELRIAAFLSGDEELIRIFKEGKDVHASVASAVFGVSVEKVDKEMRRKAKVINFGVMYGMGVNALKVQLGTDRSEAQKFYDDYFKTFKGLAEYLDRVKVETAKRGYTETVFGRRRYFEGINSRLPFIRAAAERMAINAPIQGTEADIIKLAMIEADKLIKEEGMDSEVSLVLQVHDELVYEMKKELVAKIAPKIQKIMESQMDLETTKGVPIIVDISVGENWGKMSRF
jgi:DNA polymerase-1